MESSSRRSLQAGERNPAANMDISHEASSVTQGTERTEARLSSCRSRALSSLLSTSTTVALANLELATARGSFALFCYKVRNARLSRVLLAFTVLFDCLGNAFDATNAASPALVLTSHILLFLGFICTVVTGACSRGLWSSRRAYCRTWSGWLDSLVLIDVTADLIYRIGVFSGWWIYTPASLVVLPVLRNLRAWSLLRICRTFRSAIRQLGSSANDLAAVCIFVLTFSVLVLIVLLHFYGFTCWYRCYPELSLPPEVQASDSCSADSFYWDLDESQFKFCSTRKSPCKEGTQCRNIFLHSVTSSCSPEERRRLQERAWDEMQANEEVGFGVIGVQTLGAAAVTLLQGFTLEGWAFTMQTQANGDSRSDGLVIYTAFPVMVIIGGMLLMNLAIAVLWEAFDRHHSEAPTRPAILKESEWRVYQLLGTDWIKYLMVELDQKKNCISEHIPPSSLEIEDTTAQTDVGFLAKIKRMCSGHWRTLCRRVIRELEIRFPEIQNRLRFLFMELKGYAFRLATNKFFSVAMLVLVVLDIICMFAHTDNATSVVLSVLDLLSSSAFVLEAIVLLLAFGKRCMEDGFLCLDILAAILAVIDGFFALLLCSEIVGCRSSIVKIEGVLGTVAVVLSLVRPLRIFKLLKFFSSLRLTAELLLTLHNTLLPYILLIIYCCAVVAQLGLFLFFDPKYVSTHAGTVSLNLTKYFNFENAGNSLLLLLTIFTGEAWDVFVKEIDQVYSGELESLTFDSHKLSDKILSAPSRVTAINTFLFFSVLFLNCLIFNLYGAIMIGQFTQTQKALSVKYAARFISTCRIAGIAMPAADALQGENAQALYTQANMATVAERDELIKAITTGGVFSFNTVHHVPRF